MNAYKKYNLVIFIILFCLMQTACSVFSKKQKHHENPIARVDNAFLYPSDISSLTIGLSKEDSALIIKTYTEQWVRKQLLLEKAEENVSLDVEKMVEDYRQSLLISTYENMMVEQKVSNDISEGELMEAYENYKSDFLLDENAFEFQYVILNAEKLEVAEQLRKKLSKNEEESMNEALELLAIHSPSYEIGEGHWFLASELQNNFNLQANSTTKKYKQTSLDENRILVYNIITKTNKGDVSPLGLVENDIRNIILFKRKREYLDNLKERIYQNAKNSNSIEIF